MGFLYSTKDHRVEFTCREEGIDLFLRIEANPSSNPNPKTVLTALRVKIDSLKELGSKVLIKGDSGNGNKHTLLIVQMNLARVIHGKLSGQDQLEAIFERLGSWGKTLFGDGELEEALKTVKP